MKLKLICLVLLVGLWASAQTNSGWITLGWNNPNPAGSVDQFVLYSSTNMAVPLSNWARLTTFVGTALTGTVRIEPGQRWFYLTCSNSWGESIPSNVASTSPVLVPATLNISTYYRTNAP